MSQGTFRLPRLEGEGGLEQSDTGQIQIVGAPPRDVEGLLAGRLASEAVYLTQQIGADSSVSHALAAVMAIEDAQGKPLAHNGLLLRDLLHGLSLLHAHLRNIYLTVLPDYLPPSALAGYKGNNPALLQQKQALLARSKEGWQAFDFRHPFSQKQAEQLLEGRQRAIATMSVLQKMMARLGGKFPYVMSIVSGGVSIPVDEPLVLRLREYLSSVASFLESQVAEDVALIVKAHPETKTLGRGGQMFLCVGSVGDVTGPDASFFSRGVAMEERLEAFIPQITESVETSFYKIPARRKSSSDILIPAPGKAGAYSWIKAPRYKGLPVETGPLARLVVTFQAGSRSHAAPVVGQLESALGVQLAEVNTVAGRLMATAGEIAPLTRRCMESLLGLLPGQPSVIQDDPERESGEGVAHIEGPAGSIRHKVVLRRGQIVFYDIISPSTWNGSSQDEKGQQGALELALNGKKTELSSASGKSEVSKIIHSYSFSASDAIH